MAFPLKNTLTTGLWYSVLGGPGPYYFKSAPNQRHGLSGPVLQKSISPTKSRRGSPITHYKQLV